VPRGPFTLASAARFIAGWPPANKGEREPDDEVVRLGFLVDDWSGHAGLVLRQDSNGTVRGEIVESTAADPGRVRAQAARILSLDHDATGYAAVGERDPVVGELQRALDWLRPVLFHSPYEAACWAVISTRLRHVVAARVRDGLAAEHGRSVSVEGTQLLSFPAPERLLALSSVEGLSEEKLRRLHAIADAAVEGLRGFKMRVRRVNAQRLLCPPCSAPQRWRHLLGSRARANTRSCWASQLIDCRPRPKRSPSLPLASGDESIGACSFRSPISPSRLCCGCWSGAGAASSPKTSNYSCCDTSWPCSDGKSDDPRCGQLTARCLRRSPDCSRPAGVAAWW
jgi:hypothetical protein